MREVSNRFKDALGTTQKRVTNITATPPNGQPINLNFISGSVSADISRSARYQANLELSPKLGQNLFDTIAAPGTIINIKHGINFGSTSELIDVFYGEIVSGSADIFGGNIRIGLADMWTKVDRCRFLEPFTPQPGFRGQRAAEVVLGAVPTSGLHLLADGGQFSSNIVYKMSRTEFVEDMEKDGTLDIAFEPDGFLRVRPKPTLDPSNSVWVFQSGTESNLETVERTRPFDRLYNTVVVKPATDTQSWDAQYVTISDPDHPRHFSKIGYVPYFYASPTIASAENALQVAGNRLKDILGLTETASLGALSNPALEPGDVVTIVHQATATDPGFQAIHIIDSWDLDLVTGSMNLNTRSSNIVAEEEVTP